MSEQVYKIPLVLEPQPEGGYTITSPVVPDLVTEADTLDQVIPHVADAVAALLELYEDLGKPIPPALRPLLAESDTLLWTEALVPAVTA
ncbi:MAG TPA: type II toxin-antitoxin system HicB family antitoxin [Anaerolineae bacterium]|nr:type II toxin-antitoxin system HicB family antitoxin [Anaerolineae bacterium]